MARHDAPPAVPLAYSTRRAPVGCSRVASGREASHSSLSALAHQVTTTTRSVCQYRRPARSAAATRGARARERGTNGRAAALGMPGGCSAAHSATQKAMRRALRLSTIRQHATRRLRQCASKTVVVLTALSSVGLTNKHEVSVLCRRRDR